MKILGVIKLSNITTERSLGFNCNILFKVIWLIETYW